MRTTVSRDLSEDVLNSFAMCFMLVRRLLKSHQTGAKEMTIVMKKLDEWLLNIPGLSELFSLGDCVKCDAVAFRVDNDGHMSEVR